MSFTLYNVVRVWLAYMAVEPYARRLWPQSLISWTRFLDGRVRDPLVGRDFLIGVLGGVCFAVLLNLHALAPTWLGLEPVWPIGPNTGTCMPTLLGARYGVGDAVLMSSFGFWIGLIITLFFFLVLRIILRKQWLAAIAWIAVTVPYLGTIYGQTYVSWIFHGAACAIVVMVLIRSGLLASCTLWFVWNILAFPMTPDLTAWYAGSGLLALGIVAALAAYGGYASLGGNPLSREVAIPST